MAKLFVVSAPSGSGKTTIVKAVLEKNPNLIFSISATTREKRNNETNGKDYFFLTTEKFKKKIENNEFAEYEIIYGEYYGTSKREIENALSKNLNMVFDIDVNGALSIKKNYPNDSILIFIVPPNIEILKERLLKRKTESQEKIKKRLERFPEEMNKIKEFNFIIKNENLSQAIAEVNQIILSNKNK